MNDTIAGYLQSHLEAGIVTKVQGLEVGQAEENSWQLCKIVVGQTEVSQIWKSALCAKLPYIFQ